MIAAIHPDMITVTSNGTIVFAHGIGYSIHLSERASSSLKTGNIIFTRQTWSDSTGPALYGFLSEDEVRVFNMLLSAPGIGPSAGMAVVNNMSPSEVYMNIDQENVESFTAIKGIGPKTAKQLILSLKKEIGSYDKELAERHSALIGAATRLGFKKTEAIAALSRISGISSHSEEEGVKELIKELQKNKHEG